MAVRHVSVHVATIGWILIAVGVILIILGALNRSVGPRRYYY